MKSDTLGENKTFEIKRKHSKEISVKILRHSASYLSLTLWTPNEPTLLSCPRHISPLDF